MIPPAFEYLRPNTIPEAVALLQQHGDEAKILSGGQSLIPMMKLRLARPGFLIDINRIPGLAYIREEGGFLKIGGLTRESDFEASAVVKSRYPLLLETAAVIADPQVRNLATVGGNLAHGDPANDHPATMLALGAQIVVTGAQGERVIPIESFFVSLFTTALKPDEILTEIRIPVPPAKSSGAYLKVERKVGDFATVAVAVQLTLDGAGAVLRAGIGLTNVGPRPVKAQKAEDFLKGKKLDDAAITQAAQLAADDAHPSSDLRGPADYKKALVKELTKRAIAKAAGRAK
ncbi:MAG TPA: xanthine dehydrogenase family protein subunit M [Candidatus Saccharimonadales bacterium]|jgi:carbon-monoxide dehydrogenase medium subunit|nr:xanthine dehydrogenase family protein subunit M [Candidatus Saccharimonadales bacterium]